jgi:hypothetical protein
MDSTAGIRALAQLGYEGPFATQCSQAVDEELKRAELADPKKFVKYALGLVDRIFVFEAEEILTGSADCFCAVKLVLKQGEVLLAVPWMRQYREGACMCLFRMGDVGVLEVELVLAQLIEIIQFGEEKNDQQYLM